MGRNGVRIQASYCHKEPSLSANPPPLGSARGQAAGNKDAGEIGSFQDSQVFLRLKTSTVAMRPVV